MFIQLGRRGGFSFAFNNNTPEKLSFGLWPAIRKFGKCSKQREIYHWRYCKRFRKQFFLHSSNEKRGKTFSSCWSEWFSKDDDTLKSGNCRKFFFTENDSSRFATHGLIRTYSPRQLVVQMKRKKNLRIRQEASAFHFEYLWLNNSTPQFATACLQRLNLIS